MKGAVLVTGGAGYVGSHACKALDRAGYVPVVLDNLSRGNEWSVKWGPLERGDVLDRARLDDVIRKYQPEAVLHFAAFAYVGESVENPSKYYRNNVCGSLILLEALRDHGIDCIVFSSTCAIYGVPERLPISEMHPQVPVNPYGTSKLTVERMIEDFGTAYGLRSVCLRYFNASGADPEGEVGEEHVPETHLIPLVLAAAAGRRESISVYGTDYPTTDGTCIRDYIHVTDLADAHVRALRYLKAGGDSVKLNLGTGQGISVRSIIEKAQHVTGRQVAVINAPRRSGDPPQLVADAAQARHLLGWAPNFPNVEAHIAHAWDWLVRAEGRR